MPQPSAPGVEKIIVQTEQVAFVILVGREPEKAVTGLETM